MCFELEVPNSIYSTAKPHTPGREKCQMCNGLPFRQHSDGKLIISYTHFYIEIF